MYKKIFIETLRKHIYVRCKGKETIPETGMEFWILQNTLKKQKELKVLGFHNPPPNTKNNS